MKTQLFFILSILTVTVNSQTKWTKPNYGKIRQEVMDKSLPLFYSSLFTRYLKGETTLSMHEKECIYYGFQFSSKYSPAGVNIYEDSLKTLLSKKDRNTAVFELGKRYCDSILSHDPMHLKILNIQTNLFKLTGDIKSNEINLAKMNIILDAILNSGDGLTDSSAYFVLDVNHEYALLPVIGLKFSGNQTLLGKNDYLTVEKNEDDVKGIYFDISASFKKGKLD